MIDTPSYLNAKKDAHWPTRLSPPTFLKVDQLVAASCSRFASIHSHYAYQHSARLYTKSQVERKH